MDKEQDILFKEPTKTFMEILKVSNREVPFANVLAFFFRPRESHNLGSLFLDALLATKSTNIGFTTTEEYVEEIPEYDIDSVQVIVEQKTKKNNRLDLLIITNVFVVAIEFKINHDLNNPLDDYKSHIEKYYSDKRKFYFILTPYKKDAINKAFEHLSTHNNFRQIILRHFINRVKEQIKNSTKFEKNEKYAYFLDFIQTVENREIRSKRNVFLEKLKNDLVKNDIRSTYIKNISGGFLQIDRGKLCFKVRFTTSGIQIEKWKEKIKEIIYQPNKNLELNILIEFIIKECKK